MTLVAKLRAALSGIVQSLSVRGRNISVSGGGSLAATGDIVIGDVFNYFPPRAAVTASHQLSMPVADFVGREEELKTIVEKLLAGKPVGIFGMGGLGKTELSRAAAHRVSKAYPDAQIFLELLGTSKPPRTPEDALFHCIFALKGPSPELQKLSLPELRDLYLSALSGKRALVILDNASSLRQLSFLIPPPGCALLFTSRSAIQLPGVSPINLSGLHPNEANALFISIAPNVPEDIAHEICLLCGYLPLAIRAAASRLAFTPDLDAAEYRTQLQSERKRLELIANSEIGVTVEASFNLSYKILEEADSSVFRRLAVFPGTWDAAAEEPVCQDQMHSCLSKLAQLNLVLYDRSAARYRLHDLVRLFAAARLHGSELDEVKSRHAEYFTDLMVQAVPPGNKYDIQSEEYQRCKYEWGNIRAAQAWAATNLTDKKAALCCITLGFCQDAFLFEGLMPPGEHNRWLEDALRAARKRKDMNLVCNFLVGLGAVYYVRGDKHRAIETYREAAKVAKDNGLSEWRGRALDGWAGVLASKGEYTEQALSNAKEAVAILNAIGSADAANAQKTLEWVIQGRSAA
jgi:predicted ATPase